MTPDLDTIRAGALQVLDASPHSLRWYIESTLGPVLCNELHACCQQIQRSHALPEGKRDTEEVVHYTSLANLYRMIRSQIRWNRESSSGDDNCPPSFRLYDSVHLNDPTEGTYIVHGLPDTYRWLTEFEVHHGYIASFIRCGEDDPHDDELHQDDLGGDDPRNKLVFWRTYGGDGTGCSITLFVPRQKLYKVLYEPQERDQALGQLRPILDTLVEPLLTESQILPREAEEEILRLLAKFIWAGLGSIRYLYKNPSYRFERECRAVQLSSDITAAGGAARIHHTFVPDSAQGQLRHYYCDEDLPLTKLFDSSTEITIGPSMPQKRDVARSITTLLRRGKLYGTVKFSEIPYRGKR